MIMTNEHILNIGFELETGVFKKFNKSFILKKEGLFKNIKNENNIKFREFLKNKKFISVTDGSIHLNKKNCDNAEFNSCVYEDINTKKDLKIILQDFKELSEFIGEINNTMGLHFHISFKNFSDYYSLLNYKFFEVFINGYIDKFKNEIEQKRINNNFCSPYLNEKEFNLITRNQLKFNYKCARYKAINYNSFNIHKTIEFRIFPSTKSLKKFKEYLYFLYDCIINYLKEIDKRQKGEIEILIKKQAKFNKEDFKKEIINLNEFSFID